MWAIRRREEAPKEVTTIRVMKTEAADTIALELFFWRRRVLTASIPSTLRRRIRKKLVLAGWRRRSVSWRIHSMGPVLAILLAGKKAEISTVAEESRRIKAIAP